MDARRGRRLYTCLHCERGQRLHVSERYRMTIHVYRDHLPLDQAPFFCSLCQFRCMTMRVLEKHALQPKHVSDAQARGGEARRFLGQNHSPKQVMEGVDFRLATGPEVSRRGVSLQEDIVSPEEEELEGAEQGQGLINISVTPQMLAELLGKKPGVQSSVLSEKNLLQVPAYDPFQPGFARPCVSVGQPRSTTINDGDLLNLGFSGGSPFIPIKPVSTPAATVPAFTTASLPLCASPASQYMPSFGDSLIHTGVDPVPNLQSKPATSTTTTTVSSTHVTCSTASLLNTPVICQTPLDFTGTPEVEDLNEQLLGKDEGESCFSPVTTKVDKGSQTKVSHTKSDMTPTASSLAITQLSETIRLGLEKIHQAVERNSRRLEEVNRSMGTVAGSISRMEGSLDKVIARQTVRERRDSTEGGTKKPRLESKENHPPKDTKQQRQSRK